jgi:hypothetical protein
VIVGGAQCFDVARPCRAGIAQTFPSPRKPFTAEPHHKKVGHQAGMMAIAVRERVYADKPVMKTHGDFITSR